MTILHTDYCVHVVVSDSKKAGEPITAKEMKYGIKVVAMAADPQLKMKTTPRVLAIW